MAVCIKDKSKCSGCHACYSVCPKRCIEMKSDEEGFQYPFVEQTQCINCGLCDKVCPITHPIECNSTDVVGYAAKAKDDNIRMNSSSGGIFYLLASYVINNGGVVFGAALDKQCRVKHICIDSKKYIIRLQRSKYVQSEIGDSFINAKRFLDDGKLVLFTGTPCQIAGLYSFLSREYDNLYTQDIACMGVPSPLVWEKYKEHIGDLEKATVKNVNYRDKTTGWKDYSIRISLDNGENHAVNHNENMYMQDFLLKYDLRPSCYDCKFKGIKRCSDITLADFWGIGHVLPDFYDDKGVSFVVLQSEKGKRIFEEISDNIVYRKTDLNEATKYNSAIVESVLLPYERKAFFRNLSKGYTAAHKAAKRMHFISAVKRKILKSQ